MNIIEFLGKIEKGIIQVPTQYQMYESSTVEVVLRIKDKSSENNILGNTKSKPNLKQYLNIFEQPIDALKYQKDLRNEW